MKRKPNYDQLTFQHLLLNSRDFYTLATKDVQFLIDWNRENKRDDLSLKGFHFLKRDDCKMQT